MDDLQPTPSDQPAREPALVPGPPSNRIFFGPDGLRPFWGLLIFILIVAVPMGIIVAITQMTHYGAAAAGKQQADFTPLASILMEWSSFAGVFCVTWVMSCIEGRSVFDYGFARSNRRIPWLLTGACWGVLWLSVLVGILVYTGHLVVTGVLLGRLQGIRNGIEWGIAFLGTALFEESLFRGYLQFTLTRCLAGAARWIAPSNRYARPIGFWAAAVLISFGFGLGHGHNPGESPIGMLCAGLAGLMFTLCLWRTGSLWWAIGLHAAWDWSQSFLYGVADSGSVSKGHLLATHPLGSPLLSGGFTGPEGSIFVLPVMVCITLVIVFTLPKRPTPFDADAPAAPQDLLSPAINSAHG